MVSVLLKNLADMALVLKCMRTLIYPISASQAKGWSSRRVWCLPLSQLLMRETQGFTLLPMDTHSEQRTANEALPSNPPFLLPTEIRRFSLYNLRWYT